MSERSRNSESDPAAPADPSAGTADRAAGTSAGGSDEASASADPSPDERSLSPLQIVGSTLASAFGVQSSRNRERDFSRGKASHFIIAGVVFTVLFVLGVVLVVNVVLSAAA